MLAEPFIQEEKARWYGTHIENFRGTFSIVHTGNSRRI
jgi:hypothetical protein